MNQHGGSGWQEARSYADTYKLTASRSRAAASGRSFWLTRRPVVAGACSSRPGQSASGTSPGHSWKRSTHGANQWSHVPSASLACMVGLRWSSEPERRPIVRPGQSLVQLRAKIRLWDFSLPNPGQDDCPGQDLSAQFDAPLPLALRLSGVSHPRVIANDR